VWWQEEQVEHRALELEISWTCSWLWEMRAKGVKEQGMRMGFWMWIYRGHESDEWGKWGEEEREKEKPWKLCIWCILQSQQKSTHKILDAENSKKILREKYHCQFTKS